MRTRKGGYWESVQLTGMLPLSESKAVAFRCMHINFRVS